MDAYLAIVSKREVRAYAPRPVPREELERILQAGRASGSSRNRQPWQFIVVQDRERLDALAETVSAPANIRGCVLAIAVVVPSQRQLFDAGRAAQNMMLAAWAAGIGTCPNTVVRDVERARELLGLGGEEQIATILSAGYPARPMRVEGKRPEDVLRRIKRKPLEEIVRYL